MLISNFERARVSVLKEQYECLGLHNNRAYFDCEWTV